MQDRLILKHDCVIYNGCVPPSGKLLSSMQIIKQETHFTCKQLRIQVSFRGTTKQSMDLIQTPSNDLHNFTDLRLDASCWQENKLKTHFNFSMLTWKRQNRDYTSPCWHGWKTSCNAAFLAKRNSVKTWRGELSSKSRIEHRDSASI